MTEHLKRLEAQANQHLMRIAWMERKRMPTDLIEKEKDLLAEIDIEIAFEKHLNPPDQELQRTEKELRKLSDDLKILSAGRKLGTVPDELFNPDK
jgi:hypothetical protein